MDTMAVPVGDIVDQVGQQSIDRRSRRLVKHVKKVPELHETLIARRLAPGGPANGYEHTGDAIITGGVGRQLG